MRKTESVLSVRFHKTLAVDFSSGPQRIHHFGNFVSSVLPEKIRMYSSGNDLGKVSDSVLSMITNTGGIELDQDPLCKLGVKVVGTDKINVFVKPLSNGDLAVCTLNRGENVTSVVIKWTDLALPLTVWNVRDLWSRKDLEKIEQAVKVRVAAHDVVVYQLAK